MDSERVLLKAAQRLGLVVVDHDGKPCDGDTFHHFVEAGYTTAETLYYNLVSSKLLSAFIVSALGSEESKDAARMRRLHAKAVAIVGASKKFEDACVKESNASKPPMAREGGRFLRRVPSAPLRNQASRKPRVADRRKLRAVLIRAHTEAFDANGCVQARVKSIAPALVWHIRRFAGRLLCAAVKTLEAPRRVALNPCFTQDRLSWLVAVPVFRETSTDSGCTQKALLQLETELEYICRAAVDLSGQGDSEKSDKASALTTRLAAAQQQVSVYNPKLLARASRQLHSRACNLCSAASTLLHSSEIEPHSDLGLSLGVSQSESVECKGQGSEEFEEKIVAKVGVRVDLSQEQWEAVQCSRSVFLQGRSGTGKTLVLVRRILRRQAEREEKQLALSRLFVTKSSMLLDEVQGLLEQAGCEMSRRWWPPEGLLCVTWDQLVQLLAEVQGQSGIGNLHPARAAINYARFITSYWPRLRPRARQLPPLLIWTEFNNRLRSFTSNSLSIKEYLQDNLAAVGIRLDTEDLQTIHGLFVEYSRMKRSAREFDDTDVAMHLRSRYHLSCLGELYIDEAQDFSPNELAFLLSLCREPDGVTVAGDTVQTVNPGSAFNFKEIQDAFVACGAADLRGAERNMFEGLARQSCQLQLRVNYRCPAGVAALAIDVARLLLERFPSCADRIQEVTVQDTGTLPLFVELPGLRPSSCIMGEGAQRLPGLDAARTVILVRTDEVRQKLRGGGVSGTVLTVAEAKGLEFDFVVMCGLLSDCPDSMIWSLADENSPETRAAHFTASVQELMCSGNSSVELSHQDHRKLCRVIMAIPEFKSIYVAVTRAKVGCAILECKHDPGVWASLLSRWERSGLVEQWSGARSYVLEAAGPPCQTGQIGQIAETRQTDQSGQDGQTDQAAGELEVVNAPLQLEALPPNSNFHDEVMRWLEAEIAARDGHMQKKAHAALRRERLRLRKGGSVDKGFCETFEATFGRRDCSNNHAASMPSTSEANVTEELPSLVPALERHFGGQKGGAGTTPATPEKLGFQMLAHAADNPRERWQIFPEARRALQQAIEFLDLDFAAQLPCVGMSESDEPQIERVLWRRQVCAVLQEAIRMPSLHGAAPIALIKRLDLWKHVFSFLRPPGEADVHNAVALVAEQVREFCQSREKLNQGIVLALAWHTCAKALHDPVQHLKEDAVQDSAREAFTKEKEGGRGTDRQLQPKTQRGKDLPHELIRHLNELHALKMSRSDACAEAASAFISLRQFELAADAFGEAAAFAGAAPGFVREFFIPGPHGLPHNLESLAASSQTAVHEHSTNSAGCWLLVVRELGCAGARGEQALLRAAAQFDQAGQMCNAACCAARAGRPRLALNYLRGLGDLGGEAMAKAMVLLCAALVGELSTACVKI